MRYQRGMTPIDPHQRNIMGGTGKNTERPKTERSGTELPKTESPKDDGKPKKPPPAPVEDDDIEDGDIATPKRDRNGDDDQPL
jgi:hypothetical protein